MNKVLGSIKVQLKDLKSNSFRAGLAPLKQEDVDEIVESINDFDWWGGLQGRRLPDGTIEIAVGHRRLQALGRVYGDLYQTPVRIHDFTDAEMLAIMCRDNSYRHSSDEERMACVHSVKSFLESSAARGKTTLAEIVKFMGPRNWPHQRVSELLKRIEQEAAAEQSIPIDAGGILDIGVPVTPAEATVGSATLQQVAAVLDEIEQDLPKEKTTSGETSVGKPDKSTKGSPLSTREGVMARLNSRKSTLTKDLADIPPELHSLYLAGLRDYIEAAK